MKEVQIQILSFLRWILFHLNMNSLLWRTIINIIKNNKYEKIRQLMHNERTK